MKFLRISTSMAAWKINEHNNIRWPQGKYTINHIFRVLWKSNFKVQNVPNQYLCHQTGIFIWFLDEIRVFCHPLEHFKNFDRRRIGYALVGFAKLKKFMHLSRIFLFFLSSFLKSYVYLSIWQIISIFDYHINFVFISTIGWYRKQKIKK